MSQASPNSIISLPKGGGAMQGLGEKFSPDLHTGTGNFTIPVALPPGRNGFQPQINLVYSTGNGNGIFGLGWSLSIPGVSRQTHKGIPRYDDTKDTFILSGAEDLVPVGADDLFRQMYRPRTEGLFARILHLRDIEAKHNYWEVKTKDGLTSFYGTPGQSGTDPAVVFNGSHIFSWKLTRTTDPFGNRIEYLYEPDPNNQPLLSQIRYADFSPAAGQTGFLVTVTFEYEERPDPFSEYRSGFEIRTTRRCKSILVETHADQTRRAKAYHFEYAQAPLSEISLLRNIQVTGFDEQDVEQTEIPPVEFGYTEFDPLRHRDFFPLTGADLPAFALSNPNVELVDLSGNGLPDFLEMNGTVRYWRNLGNGRFDRPKIMRETPAGINLAAAGVQMLDANGDGRVDLLVTDGTRAGYYPMEFGAHWDRKSFQPYAVAPSFSLKDPEVKLLDLTGDGVTDVLRSSTKFECYFNDPKEGWQNTRFVPRKSSLAEFPNVNFSDPRVKQADISGDGLQDIVLLYSGNVDYWPNLGYGNWGKRVHMRNSPVFPNGYDPRRILIGDVDGDGLADIVYVEDRRVTLWINQSGNAWSAPVVIPGTPQVTDFDAVRLVDLKGSGVSGVLWSSDKSTDGRPNMYFLDFTGGGKPCLLREMNNNIGALTRVEYGTSSEFYLDDEKRPETRWKTWLPFPVQVVKKVEVIDEISKGKLTTLYRYHHGYWDGAEREFRGFAMVEQFDTETFDTYHKPGLHGDSMGFVAVEDTHFTPPMMTKTWFHQGPVGGASGDWKDNLDLSGEYWDGDPPILEQNKAEIEFLKTMPGIPNRRARRDALRALRGSILRSEVYALDETDKANRPYTVSESLFEVDLVEAPNGDRPAIFFPKMTAQRSTQWERGEDPMTQFSFTTRFDAYGQPLEQTTVACYRGWRSLADNAGELLATRSITEYAQPLPDSGLYLFGRVAKSAAYEYANTKGKTVEELRDLPDDDKSLHLFNLTLHFYDGKAFTGLPFGEIGNFGAETRTESLVLTNKILQEAYGGPNSLYSSGAAPYFNGAQGPNWTPEYTAAAPFTAAWGTSKAGYTYRKSSNVSPYATGYYVQTARNQYDFQINAPEAKGLVVATKDALGNITRVVYDQPYQLLPEKVTDAADLITEATYNYRHLHPEQVTDTNLNRAQFEYTPMGLLSASWIKGKAAGAEGDQTRPSVRNIYDFKAFYRSKQTNPVNPEPVFVRSIRHCHHDTATDVPLPDRDETIESVEYSDGFGRQVQTRAQAEKLRFGDAAFGGGEAILPREQSAGAGGPVTGTESPTDDNVVVSGWQTYNNKGKVVEKYEPFFAQGWDFAAPGEVEMGRKVMMFYDPRSQVIRTVNPDGSEQRVIYGIPVNLTTPGYYAHTPWEAYTYDVNDLAPESASAGSPPGQSLANAAPAAHHYTPSNILIDALGRTIHAVQRNRKATADPMETIETRSTYDIQGNLLTITDALDRVAFQHVYDLAKRSLRIDSIDAGVRTTVQDAAGNVIEVRDSNSSVTLRQYDDLNRPWRLWARNAKNENLTLREQYIYGDHREESGLSKAQAIYLNVLGRPYRQYDEAGLLEFSRYDFKGNILDKSRQVIGDAPVLDAMNSAFGSFHADWTPGQPTPLDSKVYQTSFAYDALGRLRSLQYPTDVSGNRKTLRPQYNRAGALEKVELDGHLFVQHIAYNAKGQRALIAYGNGIFTRYAYDPDNFRLRRLRSEKYANAAPFGFKPQGGVLQDFQYRYDLAGNILEIRDRAPGCGIGGSDALDRLFEYDAIYRLCSATGRECATPPPLPPWLEYARCTDRTLTRAYTQTYDYDKAGNRRRLHHDAGTGSTYNHDLLHEINSNRLKNGTFSGNTYAYAYDENGNLLTENGNRRFAWDNADRMTAFRIAADQQAVPSVDAAYLYDSAGMRVKKLVRNQQGAVNTTVYIDGLFEHHRQIQGVNQVENNTLHIMDNQSRVALLRVGDPFDANDSTPALQYHFADHLGSSSVTANENGSWLNREEYYPYGETSFGSYALKRYRYSGKERDEESGLYYYGARYYAGWLGRWCSCDPVGKLDSINLYHFVHSNPITGKDMVGLSDESGVPTVPEKEVNMCKETYFTENREGGGFTETSVPPQKATAAPNTLSCLGVQAEQGTAKSNPGKPNAGAKKENPPAKTFAEKDKSKSLVTRSESEEVTVMNPEDWITQNPDLEACFRTCAKMLGKEPPSKALRIDTAKVDNTTKEKKVEVNEDKTRLGIKVINEYLEAGNPIIVGIDRGFQSTQNNGTTDHYIVIMGKGVENGQVYYRFYDPGTSHRSLGSSPNNRLFINMDNTITGQSEYVKVSWPKTTTVYTLSEVRPYESH